MQCAVEPVSRRIWSTVVSLMEAAPGFVFSASSVPLSTGNARK
jgi:hypothetical protein